MRKITLFIATLLLTAFNCTAQAQVSKTVACTAGNLANVAASYLTTVTNLTVTGTIDARDFKTMRDAMPLLAIIDLSGSTVAGYTGTDGTVGTTSTGYPTNGIPDFAFCEPSTYYGKITLTSFIYPSSVATIGESAFNNCIGLTGLLTIPTSVTTIGNDAFYNCSSFTGSLTIPTSTTTIGSAAFWGCRGFTGSLIIPSKMTTIGYTAFQSCRGFIGSLTIPSSVTTIDGFAFADCSGLTSIYALATKPIDIKSSVSLAGIDKTIYLHVPVGSKARYAVAYGWKDFTNIVDDIVPSSLNEVLSNSISIFPNPATTSITISELSRLVGDKTVTLSVVDALGSTLLVKDVEPSLNVLTLDVSAYKNGIYFVVIQTSNGSVVKRFVKE